MSSSGGQRISTELQQNECKDLKNMRDIKSVEEFDLENIALLKGDTPDDIKEKCLQSCKDYLAHNWIQQTVDTIQFKRLSGGLSNQMYFVAISKPSTTSHVPQEVVIRIYGNKQFNNLDNTDNERLTDVIIAVMIADINLGPKIYGLFESEQILHFYKVFIIVIENANNYTGC